MRRDWALSLGVVLMAAAVGIQMPQVGELALTQLYFTAPIIALGAWFLASRMPVATRLAVAAASVSTIVLLGVRQSGRVHPNDVLMFALPMSVAAVLGLCKNRSMPGSYALAASVLLCVMVVIMSALGWPDLTMVLYVAALLGLRSAPLPNSRLV